MQFQWDPFLEHLLRLKPTSDMIHHLRRWKNGQFFVPILKACNSCYYSLSVDPSVRSLHETFSSFKRDQTKNSLAVLSGLELLYSCFSRLTEFESIYVFMWVMNYFQPNSSLPTDETSQEYLLIYNYIHGKYSNKVLFSSNNSGSYR